MTIPDSAVNVLAGSESVWPVRTVFDRRTPEVDLLEVLARPGTARLHRPPQLTRALVADLVRAEVEGCELGAGGDGLGEGGCPVVADLVL